MPEDVEVQRKRNVRVKTLLYLFIPVGIFLGYVAILFLMLPIGEAAVILGILAAYLASPAGKETLIPLMILLGFPWWLVVGSLFITDICCALMIGWNFWVVLKVPWIGPRLRKWTKTTGKFQEMHPKLSNLSGIGLYFFTMIPFQGFGTITGTILGTMLGMNKVRVFITVVAGGLTTSFIIAYGLSRLVGLYATYPLEVSVVALILIIVTASSYWYLKKFMRRDNS